MTVPKTPNWELLHPGIQKWLWQQRWTSLRDVQNQAIVPILARDTDVLISAPTAGGKTEAAFLPILSHLATDVPAGVGCLCVSPLRALINDQARRLSSMSGAVGLQVQPWHGDVTAGRSGFWKRPAQVLIITPESLEAMFIRRPADLARVLSDVRYICIDELHAFVGSVRGRQLQSLLHRVERLVDRTIPRVALSATFGSMNLAEQFLRPNRALPCISIVGTQGGAELRIQCRALVRKKGETDPYSEITRHVFSVLRGKSNLLFANQRGRVEWLADALRETSEKAHVPNEFYPHHGSLSRDQRLWVEERLRQGGAPTTAICTSTLELGVDLGDVESVAQIGPPPSVSALKQRLGRSGRRPGQPQVLRQYVILSDVTTMSAPSERLRLDLIQAIATIELMLQSRFEPPDIFGDLHCSTLVQQVLSVIAQRRGIRADFLHTMLCVEGPFTIIDVPRFKVFLRGLADSRIVESLKDGTLVPGEVGEHWLAGYDVYMAFELPEEYRLLHNGRPLGTLPLSTPAMPGTLIVFSGRRWRIDHIDEPTRTLHLIPAPSGTPPPFEGGRPEVSALVRSKMRQIMESAEVPTYLDAVAQKELVAARAEFVAMGFQHSDIYAESTSIWLAPWCSDRALNALRLAFAFYDIESIVEDAFLLLVRIDETTLRQTIATINERAFPSIDQLLTGAVFPPEQKFDQFVAESLRRESYGARHVAVEEATIFLQNMSMD